MPFARRSRVAYTLDWVRAFQLWKTRKKPGEPLELEHATTLRLEVDDMVIRFHATDIISIHPDGTYSLAMGGYNTMMTQYRIEGWTPARIHIIPNPRSKTPKPRWERRERNRGTAYVGCSVHVAVPGDPMRELASMMNSETQSLPLWWALKLGGADPVVTAWKVSKDPFAMLGIVRGVGPRSRTAATLLNKIPLNHQLPTAAEVRAAFKPPTFELVDRAMKTGRLRGKSEIHAPVSIDLLTKFYDGIRVGPDGCVI